MDQRQRFGGFPMYPRIAPGFNSTSADSSLQSESQIGYVNNCPFVRTFAAVVLSREFVFSVSYDLCQIERNSTKFLVDAAGKLSRASSPR
jgi:hypothetical protein